MIRRKLQLLVSALALAAVAQPCAADIFMMKDENGVVHFTNIPTGDKRYKLVRKEAGTPPLTAAAGMPQYALPTEEMIRRYSAMVESASRTHGVEPALVHAVISAESGYNPYAVSRTGARGIMQLMPDTARRYSVQNIMDPSENIHAGVKYLRDLLVMFAGNKELALAAYNAGENAVALYGGIPPYRETVGYVKKVLAWWNPVARAEG